MILTAHLVVLHLGLDSEIYQPVTLFEFSVASLRNLVAVLYLLSKVNLCCSFKLVFRWQSDGSRTYDLN